MKNRLYLAYGSNLNTRQMAIRCPTAKPIAKSWLHGYELEFRGHPDNAHATVTPSPEHEVPVVIWEITEADERALDRYEGVSGGYYTKEYLTVEVDGKMEEALIYIMAPRPYGLPSDDYWHTICVGYGKFGFDTKYVSDAIIKSCEKTAPKTSMSIVYDGKRKEKKA